MIINPGSSLFDSIAPTHPALVDYNDYPNAATTVASLNNNPVVVLS